MAGLIDSTMDELDTQLRYLKREVARLESFRRQLEPAADDEPAASERGRSNSSMPLRAWRTGVS
ncbi:MAG TPA: hypothetical protein VGI55_18505 [Solirubrobacteraceae bacterium]